MSENLKKITTASSELTNSSPKSEAKNVKYYDFTHNEKLQFYRILKQFLEEPRSLQEGEWFQCQHDWQIFKFIYGKKNCKVSILDPKTSLPLKHRVIATLDIYLCWGEKDKHHLSLKSLQRVHDELKFLKLQNEKVDDCFNLAKGQIVEMDMCDGTLQIICDDVFLTFTCGVYGTAFDIKVLFDDKKDVPVCYIKTRENGQCKTEVISGSKVRKVCPDIIFD